MVVAAHRQRNDPAWPGVVLWKGGVNVYNSEGNHGHLLIACISEQSQEVCESFFLYKLHFIYTKCSLGQSMFRYSNTGSWDATDTNVLPSKNPKR